MPSHGFPRSSQEEGVNYDEHNWTLLQKSIPATMGTTYSRWFRVLAAVSVVQTIFDLHESLHVIDQLQLTSLGLCRTGKV